MSDDARPLAPARGGPPRLLDDTGARVDGTGAVMPRPLWLRGRLDEAAVFPAGWAGHEARRVTLADGERARVVLCHPEHPLADAPAVLFVHGWGCSAYSWRHNLGPTAAAGYRCLAPDLRGHGFSDKPLAAEPYTVEALADMVRDTARALDVERAVVVAHSMGGAVALRLARRAPELVAGLVLVAPVGFGGVARTRWLQALTPPLVEGVLPRLALRSVIALGLRMGYGRLGVAPTARDVDEYWAPTGDPRFARAMRRVAHAFAWGALPEAELAAITCPTHCLFGEADGVIALGGVREAVARLPRGRVDVVPGAGHVVPEEVPEVVNAAVLGMLADVRADAATRDPAPEGAAAEHA